jgi:hypothetical protein
LPSTSASSFNRSNFSTSAAKISKLSNGHSSTVLPSDPLAVSQADKLNYLASFNLLNRSALLGYHQLAPQRQYTRKFNKRNLSSENPLFAIQTSVNSSPDLTTLSSPSTSVSSFARNDISLNHVNEAPQNNGQSSSGAGSSTASHPDSSGGEEASPLEPKEKKKASLQADRSNLADVRVKLKHVYPSSYPYTE